MTQDQPTHEQPRADALAEPGEPASLDTEPAVIGLYYEGDGSQFVAGVPASDFNTGDRELASRLVASGLYRADVALPPPPAPPRPEPEPEAALPPPREPFWWEPGHPRPEAVAYAKAVLARAEQPAPPAETAPEATPASPDAPAAPEV